MMATRALRLGLVQVCLLALVSCTSSNSDDAKPDASDDASADASGQPDAAETCLAGCLVDGECFDEGATSPNNLCLACKVELSRVALSPLSGVRCDDGAFCTLDDTCQAGVCSGSPRSCDDQIGCNGSETCDNDKASCVAGSGTCAEGELCDALAGKCVLLLTCPGCLIDGTCYGDGQPNPTNPCQVCSAAATKIAWSNADGGLCDDGAYCTLGESCSGGSCVGGNARNCNDQVGCNGVESCDETANSCQSGTNACGSGALCDVGADACVTRCDGCVIAGSCYAAASRNPVDQCQVCTPLLSSTAWSPNDGARCEDGLFCTANDTCQGSSCTGVARACADGVACNGSESCDESVDACRAGTATCAGGTLCDPTADSCVTTCSGCVIAGVCFGAGQVNPDNTCEACKVSTSATAWSPNDGARCDDGLFCTDVDLCSARLCAGTPRDCSDGVACDGLETCDETGDVCAHGAVTCAPTQVCDLASDSCLTTCAGCVIGGVCYAAGTTDPNNSCAICDTARSRSAFSANDGAGCDDGLFCTRYDVCGSGVCAGTAGNFCSDAVTCNGVETCNETTDACVPAVSSCAAGQVCDTSADLCVTACTGCVVAGVCYATGTRNPTNQCQVCAPSSSATTWSSNLGASCDDGLFCTVADTCGANSCTGTPRACADSVACNGTETCNEVSDACVAGSATCASSTLCDPGTDACITTCSGCVVAGICYGDGQTNPGNSCEACNVALTRTAFSANDGARCDDGLFCTDGDVCAARACSGSARNCSDSVACDGVETCDEATDVCAPGTTTCGFTEVCDRVSDSCLTTCAGCVVGGVCFADGTTDPANACQICDIARSRVSFSANNGASCDDGAFCTRGDVCSGGLCAGTSSNFCDDGVVCNGTESCNETTDRCTAGGTTCGAGQVCEPATDLCVTACSGCVISGVCYAPATTNPSDPCSVCTPLSSRTAWTNNTGASCDDGLFCTAGDVCNVSGVCTGAARSCTDGVACNGSEACNESTDRCDSGTTTCGAGTACNTATDTCVVSCAGCTISGVCYAATTHNPANACQICVPGSSSTAWSPDTGAACDDGLYCTVGETCSAGATCSGSSARSCADAVTCNGTETCNEATDRCDPGTPTCPGEQLCNTSTDICGLTCVGGTTLCSAACVNRATDPANCGSCGNVCSATNAAGVCVASSCRYACDSGFADCDLSGANGCEIDTNTDEANCGRCNTTCSPTQFCAAGQCLSWQTSAAPVAIPSSTGCSLIKDSNADQIDALTEGAAYLVLRCPAGLSLSTTTDGGATFSAPSVVLASLPSAATVYARSLTDLYIMYAVSSNVWVVRSTNGGSTWGSAVLVASNFASSGPGPALMLTGDSTNLYATWSTTGTTGYVSTSADNGSNWTALPNVTIGGTNYCPDLAIDVSTSDLVYINEPNRRMFRLPTAAVSWTTVGSVGSGTSYSDFAGKGPYIYATGLNGSFSRAPLAAAAPFVITTLATTTSGESSIDVNTSGDLYIAHVSTGGIKLDRWIAGDSAFVTSVDVVMSRSFVALASPPGANTSVTAIFSTTSAPIMMFVQSY